MTASEGRKRRATKGFWNAILYLFTYKYCLCFPTTYLICNGAQHMFFTKIVVSCCMWKWKEVKYFTLMNDNFLIECVVIPSTPPPPHHVCTIHVCLNWWIMFDLNLFVWFFFRKILVVPTTLLKVIIKMLLCTSLWKTWLVAYGSTHLQHSSRKFNITKRPC